MASRRPTRPVYAPSRDSTCVAPDVVNCGSKEGMKRREPQVFGVCSLLEYLLFFAGAGVSVEGLLGFYKYSIDHC